MVFDVVVIGTIIERLRVIIFSSTNYAKWCPKAFLSLHVHNKDTNHKLNDDLSYMSSLIVNRTKQIIVIKVVGNQVTELTDGNNQE
jgi:hypothetical protein